MSAYVSGLATTAVKSTRLATVDHVELNALGACGNRAFCVIDGRDRMVNAKNFPKLQTVLSSYDLEAGELALTFPDGTVTRAPLRHGEQLTISFFSQPCPARLVLGPWASALSDYIGAPLRIVEPEVGVDRGRDGGVSLISRASVEHLAEVAETDSVDVRRFRMLIEVEGLMPYEEDTWVGRKVTIGPARVAFRGNIGRCAVTTRDPDTAVADLPTLKLLASYRRVMLSTEPIPFGIYGEVLDPGPVRLGDSVALEA
jgi:MOSC domain-containing protein